MPSMRRRRIAPESLEDRIALTFVGSATSIDEILASITTTGSTAIVERAGWSEQDSADPAGVSAQLAASRSLIEYDTLINDPRFASLDGSGFSVVILDTGIDLNHPFFGPDNDSNGVADRIVYNQDFIGGGVNADDVNGHGTHVSSIIGSQDPLYRGVAPGANLIHLQVLDDAGFGTFAAVESALQWVIANVATYNIVSVNLSLSDGSNGSVPVSNYGISDEFAALTALGVVPVAAAGNLFNAFESVEGVSFPASDINALAVGAVWSSDFGGPIQWQTGATDFTTGPDRVVSFSQRHETLTDLFAPGALITAAGVGGGLATYAGTSQASPFVAGAVALAQQLAVQEIGRQLTFDEVRQILISTAANIVDGDDEDDNVVNTGHGFHRLDLFAMAEEIEAIGTIHVDASMPAANAILTSPPTQFTIDFSEPFDVGSVDPQDLVVNGLPADSVQILDADSAVFSFMTSPVVLQGLQTIAIDAGLIESLDQELMQQPFSATFRYDALPMQVTSVTPSPSSTVPLPLTEMVIDLNEPVLASSVDASDLDLSLGQVSGFQILDADTIRYTIAGVSAEGLITVGIAAGALTDAFGNPIGATSFSYDVDVSTLADLEWFSVEPAASGIVRYDHAGLLNTPGDVDGFDVTLSSGQLLTATALVSPTIQPRLRVLGPSLQVVLETTASAAGVNGLLSVVATTSGTYRVEILDAGTGTGTYDLTILQGSRFEAELLALGDNSTPTTAENLDGSFVPVTSATSRASVLGGFDTEVIKAGPDGFGYEAIVVPADFEDIRTTGTGILAGADNSFSILGPSQLGTFTFDFYGTSRNQFYVDSNGRITFLANDGSPYNSDLTFGPGTATIAVFWDDLVVTGSSPARVYWEVRGTVGDRRLIIQWNEVQFKGSAPGATITFQAILYEQGGEIQFNYLDLASTHAGSEGASATVGIKDIGFQLPPIGLNRLLLAFDEGPNEFVGTGKSVRLGTQVVPVPSDDHYRFTGSAQDVVTITTAVLDVGQVGVDLLNASGDVIATAGAINVSSSRLESFVLPADGTYYARVHGSIGTRYTLQVMVGGTSEVEPNDQIESAQLLNDYAEVVGRIGEGTNSATGTGVPVSGPYDVVGSNLSIGFSSDGSFIGDDVGFRYNGLELLEFGQELASYSVAFNGQNFTNGAPFVSTDFAVAISDLSVGSQHAVRIQGMIVPGVFFERIVQWDESSNYALVTTTLTNSTGAALDNVAILEHDDADPLGEVVTANDVVSGGNLITAATRSGAYGLGSIDPRAVVSAEGFGLDDPFAVLLSPTDPDGEPIDIAVNIAFDLGTLLPGTSVSATYAMIAGADTNVIEETFAAIADQTLSASDDGYAVALVAGQIVEISTHDPMMTSPLGQFANVAIELYDPQGNLVAADANSASDGRNALLTYTAATTGMFSVRVYAESPSPGDYVLVVNSAPSVSIAGSSVAVRANEAVFQLSAVDSSPQDQGGDFTYYVDWTNDGQVDLISVGPTATVAHTYQSLGQATIRVTAADPRGLLGTPQFFQVQVTNIALIPDPDQPALVDLVWSGTQNNDDLRFTQIGVDSILVEDLAPGGSVTQYDGVTGRLIARSQDGDDRLDASGLTTISAELNGGEGLDTLIGGEAGDLIYGDGAEGADDDLLIGNGGDDFIFGDGSEGNGNDYILGGDGNDVLVGDSLESAGADILVGEAGNDILIGDGAEGGGDGDLLAGGIGEDLIVTGPYTQPSIEALVAIHMEWNSARPIQERVDNLLGIGNTGVNGSYLIDPGVTVLNDDAVDFVLTSDTDPDWLVVSLADDNVITASPEDIVTNVL